VFRARGRAQTHARLVFIAINVVLFWYGFVLENDQHIHCKRGAAVVARGTGYMLQLDLSCIFTLVLAFFHQGEDAHFSISE
jgi:hypothetical protein